MWIVMLAIGAGLWAIFFYLVRRDVASVVVVMLYASASALTAYGVYLVSGISFQGVFQLLLIGGLLGLLVNWALWARRGKIQNQCPAEFQGKAAP